VFEWNSGHPLAQLYPLTFQRLRPLVLDQGAMTPEDHDRLLRMMSEAGFFGLSHTTFATRGRKVAA